MTGRLSLLLTLVRCACCGGRITPRHAGTLRAMNRTEMIVDFEDRQSDSPFVEKVMHGFTACAGSTIRPAESSWHLVFVREHGRTHALATGPLPTSGIASWGDGGEILWIKLRLGVFMPHMPTRNLLDNEIELPGTFSNHFWLRDSSWELPSFENADTFVNNLVKQEILAQDLLVNEALKGAKTDVSPRTLRHRFLRSTGMSRTYLEQMSRAQEAAAMLGRGASIMDTVFDLGYYDQPHLNRSLKQFIGYTPGQILRETGTPDAASSQAR